MQKQHLKQPPFFDWITLYKPDRLFQFDNGDTTVALAVLS